MRKYYRGIWHQRMQGIVNTVGCLECRARIGEPCLSSHPNANHHGTMKKAHDVRVFLALLVRRKWRVYALKT